MNAILKQIKSWGLKKQDGKWAGGLLLMLVLVFGFDLILGPRRSAGPEALKMVTQETDVPQDEVVQPLRMAVTTFDPHYDDMGALLKTLGPGYSTFRTMNLREIIDNGALRDLDVLFMTCSPAPNEWLQNDRLGNGGRPGTVTSSARPEIIERLKENLREFVARGGTLYASDWQFSLLSLTFNEFIDPSLMHEGAKQTVIAHAEDESLRKLVGDRLQLKFDLAAWKPAAFGGRSVSVLLTGDYETLQGARLNAPLLIKFPFEKGTVIFTSFHNEKQNSELETKLLKYLVFTTVLAQTEAKMTETLVQGGFKQAGRSLLSVSGGERSTTETYKATKTGPLRFSLGFENRNAKMKLTVVGPDGVPHEKEGISPLVVEIPDATVGDWKYTITAIKTPFDNFPFALSIGQK